MKFIDEVEETNHGNYTMEKLKQNLGGFISKVKEGKRGELREFFKMTYSSIGGAP